MEGSKCRKETFMFTLFHLVASKKTPNFWMRQAVFQEIEKGFMGFKPTCTNTWSSSPISEELSHSFTREKKSHTTNADGNKTRS